MINDFFGIINFDKISEGPEFSFSDLPFYSEWLPKESIINSSYSKINCLFKNKTDFDFYSDNEFQLFIYGYCYTKISSSSLQPKKRLTANELLNYYRKLGSDLFSEIKGSFCIVILNIPKKEFQVISDPLNVRQLYFYHHQKQLLISSSLNALIHYKRSINQSVTVDYKNIVKYHLFDFIPDNSTFVKNIEIIPAGSILTFNKHELYIENYWNLWKELQPEETLSEANALTELEDILLKNMNIYLSEPEKTAVALTGGYDSRLNLALMQDNNNLQFYSYGLEESYDIKIPLKLSQKLGLDYKSFYINSSYKNSFNSYASQAIYLGDGISEMSRANYLYPYSDLANKFDYILTGLFGSELIKQPTSLGLFINKNTKLLLHSKNIEKDIRKLYQGLYKENYLQRDFLSEFEEDIIEDTVNDRFFSGKEDLPLKYFYFILFQGARKYFMKELKVERPFVENLHPFFDLEFIQLLIQTPFAWVNNLTLEKNLIKSMQNHRFYTKLIYKHKPVLAKIISTHAYSPIFLNNKLLYPLLAFQYKLYKKKFSSVNSFNYPDLYLNFYKNLKDHLPSNGKIFKNDHLEQNFDQDISAFTKLISLQQWAFFNDLNIEKI